MIHSVIEVCDTIMKDQADDVPFNFMGQQAFVAKKANEYFAARRFIETEQCTSCCCLTASGLTNKTKCFTSVDKEGNIIYSKEKIRKKEVTP